MSSLYEYLKTYLQLKITYSIFTIVWWSDSFFFSIYICKLNSVRGGGGVQVPTL